MSERSLRCLEQLWKRRDGAVGAEVSTVLLHRLIADPAAFLHRYAHAPGTYEEWRSEVENLSLESIEDPPLKVREMRREAIEALQRTTVATTAQRRARDRLLRTLGKAKIRVID